MEGGDLISILMKSLESYLHQALEEVSLFYHALREEARNHPDLLKSALCGIVIAVSLIIVLSFFPGEPFSFDSNMKKIGEGGGLDPRGEALGEAVETKITEEDEKIAEERIVHSKKLQKLLGMTGLVYA